MRQRSACVPFRLIDSQQFTASQSVACLLKDRDDELHKDSCAAYTKEQISHGLHVLATLLAGRYVYRISETPITDRFDQIHRHIGACLILNEAVARNFNSSTNAFEVYVRLSNIPTRRTTKQDVRGFRLVAVALKRDQQSALNQEYINVYPTLKDDMLEKENRNGPSITDEDIYLLTVVFGEEANEEFGLRPRLRIPMAFPLGLWLRLTPMVLHTVAKSRGIDFNGNLFMKVMRKRGAMIQSD